MKNAVLCDVSGMALVRTDVSEECIPSIRMESISGLGTLAITVFWDVTPCGSCTTDDSEERNASIIRLKIIKD
jgi:hypothetical protein